MISTLKRIRTVANRRSNYSAWITNSFDPDFMIVNSSIACSSCRTRNVNAYRSTIETVLWSYKEPNFWRTQKKKYKERLRFCQQGAWGQGLGVISYLPAGVDWYLFLVWRYGSERARRAWNAYLYALNPTRIGMPGGGGRAGIPGASNDRTTREQEPQDLGGQRCEIGQTASTDKPFNTRATLGTSASIW